MTPDRTDRESDETASSESTDAESDSLSIPSVSTEDAGSGLWADLKRDSTDESIDMPGVSSDVDAGEPTSEPDVDLSEVPNDLIKTFVAVVLAINGAILAVSLGILFLVFEGTTTRSAALVVGGVVLFGFAVRRYRRYQNSSDEGEGGEDSEGEGGKDDESESDDNNEVDGDEEAESGTRTGSP